MNENRQIKQVLFLSPHYDDAVLSCGGAILDTTQSGVRAVVVTVFSGCGQALDKRDYYDRRKAEDKQALGILGAEQLELDFADAPFRNPFYRGFEEIIFKTDDADKETKQELAKRFSEILLQFKPSIIYAPLAVGTHIDHRLVFDAVFSLKQDAAIYFYEDRPYSLLWGAVYQRLLQLGAAGEAACEKAASLPLKQCVFRQIASLRQTPYIQCFLPPGPARFRSVLKLVQRFKGQADGKGLRLTKWQVDYDQAMLSTLTKAAASYTTELGALYGSIEGFVAMTGEYARVLGSDAPFCERYWSAGSAGN